MLMQIGAKSCDLRRLKRHIFAFSASKSEKKPRKIRFKTVPKMQIPHIPAQSPAQHST